MDKDKLHVLETIINSLENECRIKTVGEVLKESYHYHNVNCTHKYDNYTIEEFLTLFRIDFLRSEEIIDEETANLLYKLYDTQRNLNKKIDEIAYKNLYNENKDEKEIDKLYNIVLKINRILDKYHLIRSSSEVENTFFDNILDHDYHDIDKKEDIKKFMKTINLV